MAKHKVTWRWEADIEFDTDETTPEGIAHDFINACEEGLQFDHLSDTTDFVVVEVDDVHVHYWVDSFRVGEEFCPLCHQHRTKVSDKDPWEGPFNLDRRERIVHLPGDNPKPADA